MHKKKTHQSKRLTLNLISLIKRHKRTIGRISFCIILSTIFVSLFSWSTSPIYKDYYDYGGNNDSGDSLQFQTIGEAWRHGKIPYRDTFDHKGPVIFLVNLAGFIMGGGSRYGIVVIQIVCLSIVLWYTLKIASLASKSSLWGALTAIILLIFYTRSYADGNSVQEYNLPFIAASTYYILKYITSYSPKKSQHAPKYAFLYGICICCCILTQATNAIMICAGVLTISIILIINKQYSNLLKNLAFGLLGMAIFFAPFGLYFAINGAFSEMLYSMMIYNAEYASHIGSWLHGTNGNEIREFILTYSSFIASIFIAIFSLLRKKYPLAMMSLICFIAEAYLFFKAQSFSQYATLCLMQVPILLNEFYLMKDNDPTKKIIKNISFATITIFSYNQALAVSGNIIDKYNEIKATKVNDIGYENIIEPYISDIENSSFSVYGMNSMKGIYLKYNIIPNNKYFIIQPWHASFSKNTAENIHNDFINNPPQYLLLDDRGLNSEYNINDLIKDQYNLIGQNEKYSLYSRTYTK